jgi:hypothetical protein
MGILGNLFNFSGADKNAEKLVSFILNHSAMQLKALKHTWGIQLSNQQFFSLFLEFTAIGYMVTDAHYASKMGQKEKSALMQKVVDKLSDELTVEHIRDGLSSPEDVPFLFNCAINEYSKAKIFPDMFPWFSHRLKDILPELFSEGDPQPSPLSIFMGGLEIFQEDLNQLF